MHQTNNFLFKSLNNAQLKAVNHINGPLLVVAEYSEGYLSAFNSEMSLDLLPSEKIMQEVELSNLSFQDYGLEHSKKIAQSFFLNEDQDFSALINAAQNSLKDLKNLKKIRALI